MASFVDSLYFTSGNLERRKAFGEFLDSKRAGEVARFFEAVAKLRRNYTVAEAETIYARFIQDDDDS
jgi:hypothetical protein